MAICTWAGLPYLFVTFTFNPKWPKIARLCAKHNLEPSDHLEILTRMFNMKLNALMIVLKDDKILGVIKADINFLLFYL